MIFVNLSPVKDKIKKTAHFIHARLYRSVTVWSGCLIGFPFYLFIHYPAQFVITARGTTMAFPLLCHIVQAGNAIPEHFALDTAIELLRPVIHYI